jgi:predicted dithiol-disulfide oxidoreductase (DUF899 family)
VPGLHRKHTSTRETLAAQRPRKCWIAVEKAYEFEGPRVVV